MFEGARHQKSLSVLILWIHGDGHQVFEAVTVSQSRSSGLTCESYVFLN